jgi:hypothetical protein
MANKNNKEPIKIEFVHTQSMVKQFITLIIAMVVMLVVMRYIFVPLVEWMN